MLDEPQTSFLTPLDRQFFSRSLAQLTKAVEQSAATAAEHSGTIAALTADVRRLQEHGLDAVALRADNDALRRRESQALAQVRALIAENERLAADAEASPCFGCMPCWWRPRRRGSAQDMAPLVQTMAASPENSEHEFGIHGSHRIDFPHTGR